LKIKSEKKKRLVPLASQTVGPYFLIGLTGPRSSPRMAGPDVKGERVKLICTVLDGQGVAVPDAMIEIWQANAGGKYNHPADTQTKPIDPGFLGFGRAGTDGNGACEFETIRPGRAPGRGKTLQAPHLEVSVFARGLLKRAPTRIYFADDPANDEDPVLALVPKTRRPTLMAQPVSGQPGTWRFDVHLNGAKETVFFDI
jgi:protocatechuate 3,4-dioxygenase alpha subunit